MKMRNLAGALALAAAAVLAWTAPLLAQTGVKLGYSLPPTSHYGAGAQAFADELGRLSNGKFKVEQFAGNALGGEREMVEGAQLGTVDIVISSTGPIGNFVPETLITDIPFLFRDYAHARAVLDGPIGQEILDKFPARDLIGLAWAENGFRHMTNNTRPIHAPQDARGLKVRTMENEVHMQAFRALGVLPTPMSFPELFTALQQGTVDGQENPIPVITAGKFAQVQKYLSLTGHVYSPALFIASPVFWAGLSAQERDWVRAAAKAGAAATRKKVNEVEDKGIAELRKAGMEVTTDVDRAAFQAALGPAYAEYAKRFGEANIERIRNYK